MKILLVDDSKSARYALRLQLQRYGVEVETAPSAEAAFELLKSDLPDAVLMDHMMPGLNGFEALAVIRADPRTASLPVVMCTSQEDAEFTAAAQARGAVGILPKSAAAEKLPDLLERLRAASAGPPLPSRTDPPVASRPLFQIVPKITPEPAPDLARLIEQRAGGLVDERIETRLAGLIEPLLRDLELGLAERLAAQSRQLIEARLTELRAALEARLVTECEGAIGTQAGRTSAELEAASARLVQETLPDLVRAEIEVERGQIMDLVDQYLREFSAAGAAAAGRPDERLAGLDGAITTKAKEVARREASDAAEGAVIRAQRIADTMTRQVRTSLTFVYLAVLAAALIGILAAAAGYYLPR